MYLSIKLNRIKLFLFSITLAMATCVGFILVNSDIVSAMNDGSNEYIELPIIMYHGITRNPKKQSRFVISEEEFESDLKYLKENGYKTIFMKELISYVYEDKPLPEKPIIITFDDGYYNNYLYGFPLAKKYESKIVISPIGYCTDQYTQNGNKNPNYAHISWDDINEMIKSGYVEIQNHSYNMHCNTKGRNGCKKKRGESNQHYEEILDNDLIKMQNLMKEKTGTVPNTFTYPFGAVSKDSVKIIKGLGFKATLGCENKTNKIYKKPDCLYGLFRYIRPSGPSSEEYFNKRLK